MSSSSTGDLQRIFFEGSGLTLLICVGNTLRSDDGVGPYIAERIVSSGHLKAINAGIHPEKVLDDAAALKPARIVILDAADFRGKPGEVRVIGKEHIPETSLSTHTIPLPVFTGILEEDTGAEIVFLGIQPKTMELGEGLSMEVEETAKMIIDMIAKSSI